MDQHGRLYRLLRRTLPCDTPFSPAHLLLRLETALGQYRVAMAASGADLHPAIALWRIELVDALSAYVSSDRRSLIGFARQLGFATAEWDAHFFLNVNSPADLAEAERRIGSEGEGVDPHAGGQRLIS